MDSTAPPVTRLSILVVEDDPALRDIIIRVLGRAGHAVVSASTGEDALDLLAAADFDGLYCGIELPGRVDGWEVGTTFSFIWPDGPAVYASAAASEPPGPLRTGVFLRKPFVLAELVFAFETSAGRQKIRSAPGLESGRASYTPHERR